MWAGKDFIVRWALTSLCLLLAIPPVWCRSAAVPLREAVEVDHSPVLLSDLLPADANVAVRKASAAVVLCQAPQSGSVRLLQAEEIIRSIAAYAELLPVLSIPARVAVRDSSLPIQQGSVREAIATFLRAHAWGELPPDYSLRMARIPHCQ